MIELTNDLHGFNEGIGSDYIKGGDIEDLLGVRSFSFLDDLTGVGDVVEGVGDDGNYGLGTKFGNNGSTYWC